ncbi:MAG: arginase family protein [Bryobacteraceae bacterium]
MIPLIVVPYHLAARDVEVGLGATRILDSLQWLHQVVELPPESPSDVDAVCAMNSRISCAVRGALSTNSRALVVAGNCSTASGTLAGMGADRAGVIWFDAHGDFNTPETTVSGSIEGMALAVATGACHSGIRNAAGLATHVEESRVLLAGTRDLDPAERVRLEASPIGIVESKGWTLDRFRKAAESTRAVSSGLYLHIDLDVVDPQLSPGVNFQAAGGLTPAQLLDAVELVASWPELRAAAITNYNPDRDPEGVTLRLALRLAAILGRSA